jgi:ankyrin repeat protein
MKRSFFFMFLVLVFVPGYGSDVYVWKALNDRGVIFYQQGRYAEAAAMAERALKMADEIFPANHVNIAVSLTNLANVYRTQNKHALAEPLYKRALQIDENRLGKDHPMVIRKRDELAHYQRFIRTKQKPEINGTRLDRSGKIKGEITGRYYKTPLHEAARDGKLSRVKALVKKYPNAVDTWNDFGRTPLHLAAEYGHNETAVFLLEKGTDIDVRGPRGDTPLHLAAGNGHTSTVELLLNRKADIHAEDLRGITPLHGAVTADRKEVVELLIGRGARVNARAFEGAVPLHSAASAETARLLIAAGAEVDAANNFGFTPLHSAAVSGHLEAANLLIEKGAAVNAKSQHGFTPLHEAAFGGAYDTAKLLIEKGAEINARTNSGSTPLNVALNTNHGKTAKLLRKHGGTL